MLFGQRSTTADTPQRRLAARLLRHLSNLFTIVDYQFAATTKNQAERDLRPHVIARQIWCGTRSERGSTAAAARLSLFVTWRAWPQSLRRSSRPSAFHLILNSYAQ